jgi:hypothetical protein
VIPPEANPGFVAAMEDALETYRRSRDPDLAYHKVAGVRQAIEAAGTEGRFLPPYSHRTGVRQGQKHAAQNARRTVDALWDAAGVAIDATSPPPNASTTFETPTMGKSKTH